MPLDPFVTGVVETAINKLLQDDPENTRRLTRLKGKVIKIHLKELKKDLIFVFSHQIDVLSQYEGEPDCYLALNLSVLPELREQANLTQLIKSDQLVLEGDIQLAQQFSSLLSGLKPDIEEQLSKYTGDVVAHTVVSGVKGGLSWLQGRAQKHQTHLAEVITEEWKLAPAPLEIAHFCDQVDDLNSGVSRLEARLNRLLERT